MANTKTTKDKDEKVGSYTQPGIHPNDEVDASGHKAKFDRGDPSENKKDEILDKAPNAKKNVEIPEEYKEPGIQSGDQIDASGHKKKFDRAAPEETEPPSGKQNFAEAETERSEPNYVEKDALAHKDRNLAQVAGMSEVEFLRHCLSKTASGGWTNHLDDDLRNRIEYLEGKEEKK